MIRKRGRPSSADLTTPKVIELYPRQRPPAELKGEERKVFIGIANSEAADWFSPASMPLLAQYCRHVCAASRIARLLETAVEAPEIELADYSKLLAAQRGESMALAALATKLRLTPQATRNHRGNRRAGPHPWERKPHEG